MDAFSSIEGRGGPNASGRGDGRGQAALLLIESLMHSLIGKGVLSREDFIEIVDGAAEVEEELVAANAQFPSVNGGSFLSLLADAFKIELGR
jgi:hypothetical protein